MNIDVYRDTDGSVYLVFDDGDAGIMKADTESRYWPYVDMVPESAVQLVPETCHAHRNTVPCPDCHADGTS